MFKYLLAFVLLVNVSCSVNILENFADKTTNEALMFDAKKKIDQGDYTGALAKIALMTSAYRAGRDIVALEAKAHGGLCGINFFEFILALGNLGSTRMLPFLMGSFRSGTDITKVDHCISAETLIKSLGVVGARTPDENLLMLVVSFAKVGQLLSFYADSDQDGTAAASYDVCAIAAPGTRTAGGAMPASDAAELGTGLTLAIESLGALAGIIDLGAGSMDSLTTACASLPAQYQFCGQTTTADFDVDELKAIRSFVKEGSAMGLNLGTCAGNNVSDPNCVCFP